MKIRLIPSNYLAVQWLGLRALTAVAQVQSLLGELRSYKPQGTAKKQKTKQNSSNKIKHHINDSETENH